LTESRRKENMPNWGNAAQGAAGGAALGTSILPGWGTAIGGVAGGLLGMFGGDDVDQNKQLLDQYRQMIMARGIPQADTAQAMNSDFRTNQQNLISRLEALSRGEGPSLAMAQLNEATDKNIAGQQATLASGRGNAALASLTAANNMQNLGQNAAQQSVGARIAEEQMALGQLGGAIQQGRSADEQTSQFNAQQQNYLNEANLTAKLKAMGLSDDSILNILQQQRQAAGMPTLGNQLLAGGTGALGMYLGQKYGGNRQAPNQATPAYQSLAQQFPRGDMSSGPVTSPDQLG
jgi:hypothetical protein